MPNHIKTITIFFDTEISDKEIPLFRGAILKILGEQANLLYHNHIGETSFRFSYPLIQYKRIGGKAAIVGIEEGADILGQFLTKVPVDSILGERKMHLEVRNAIPARFRVQTWQTNFRYHITRWLPLNTENYKGYQMAEGLVERISMLEHVLKGNLLSMLKGLGIFLEDELKVHITQLSDSYILYNKGVALTAFDADFSCNLSIPDFMGIGKNASIGYGVVRQTDRPQTLFLLGGHDLEMNTIKQMLGHRADCEIADKDLAWNNALLSAYSKELEEWSKFDRIYGIELRTDIHVPDNYYCIDHHNNLENMPSSLEQTAMIVGVRLNRHQQLVAANDRGYIPGMQAISASEKEIAEIRRQDREAQGISNADELLAEESIAQHLKRYPNLCVVKSLTTHFSAICDRLYPYQRLIIYTDDEWVFYGEGKNELTVQFADDIQQGRVFHGGGDNGFIGCARHSFDKESIEKIVKQIIINYENH